LSEAHDAAVAGREILHKPIADLSDALSEQERVLYQGLKNGLFLKDTVQLFQLRIAFADIVAEALALELDASGGAAYLSTVGRGFARRWHEAAFIPVITPTIVQLKEALASRRKSAA
jgi:hypothetical protein